MLLHLAVPGLLWPKDSLREAVRDLRTPALATLIGRGRVDWQPAQPFEHWLCRAFGITAAEPPCAALRLSGEGIEPGGDAWICADPVHLRFARGTLIIGSPGELDLSREEAGRPTANSLWPWGAGVLPAAASVPAHAMYADHPLARGLARLAGLPCHAVPDEGVPQVGFILLEGLAAAAHALDLHAWRDKITEMEQRWFQPLLAALKSGQVKQLRLTALGDEGIAAVTVEAGQLWKFWRRPQPLETLVR